MAQTIPQRAARGAVILLARSILLRLLMAAGGVALARVLAPAEFGVYAVVSFVVTFLTNFGDVGLGAALIQQPEEPSREELTTTFTVQLLLVSLVVAIGFLAAEPISRFYHLSSGGVWLIRVLLLSLPISLLRSIPAVLLVRELRYGRLSVVESLETLAYQITAVLLALLHVGVWSFVWAAIVRAIGGVAAAYLLSPWRPGIGFSRPEATRLLRFGLPYQLQSLLSFVKDSMTPTVIALLAGAAAVGYINWAWGMATLPLLVTEPLWRVTFPAFARAQDNPDLLRVMVERSIRLSAILFLPISFLLIGAGPEIVRFVYTDRWLPALPAFYLFSISLWAGPLVGSSFFSAFYARGRSRLPLAFTVLYAVLDWGVGVPLVLALGFNGIAVRAVLVAYGTLPLLLAAMQRVVPVRAIRQVTRPFATAAGAALLEAGLLHFLPPGLPALLLAVVSAGSLYGCVIAIWERGVLSSTLRGLLPVRLQGPLRWYVALLES